MVRTVVLSCARCGSTDYEALFRYPPKPAEDGKLICWECMVPHEQATIERELRKLVSVLGGRA